MSIAPALLLPGLGAVLSGGAGLVAGTVLGIVLGFAVHSAVAAPSSFRN